MERDRFRHLSEQERIDTRQDGEPRTSLIFSIQKFTRSFSRILPYSAALLVFILGFNSTSSILWPFYDLKVNSDAERLLVSAIAAGIIYLTFRVFFQILENQFGLIGESSIYREEMNQNELFYKIEQLTRLVARLKERKGTDADITSEDKERIVTGIIDNSNIKITDRLVDKLAETFHNNAAGKIQENSLLRLSDQVATLGSRANTSLTIGIIFALVGLFVLYYTFFIDLREANFTIFLDFFANYLPRLTIIIIIEVIAFFFLRLYSRALTELRYVQNEITNIEIKLIALHNALAHGSSNVTNNILTEMSKTERNHVLEKGQTTVEIEKERADTEGMTVTIAAAAKLLHGYKEELDGDNKS